MPLPPQELRDRKWMLKESLGERLNELNALDDSIRSMPEIQRLKAALEEAIQVLDIPGPPPGWGVR